MGLRVRVVLVVLSLLAVLALAVPLALSLAQGRTTTLADERGRQLAAMADAAAASDSPLQRLVDRYYEVYGEGLLIIDSDGRTLAARGLDISKPGVAAALSHALVDAPADQWAAILPWDRQPLLATAGIRSDGELVGAVVLEVDARVAARDIGRAWLWVAIGCLVVLIVAAVVARALTRWVLRPITGLERAVADMTEGVAGPPADVAGPPELRHFTSAFNTMAQVVRASLERQRRLVADASHELRTPLTSLITNLELLAEQPDDPNAPALVASALAEAGELRVLINDLVDLARDGQASFHVEDVRLDLVAQRVAARAADRAPGLTYELDCRPTLVRGDPDALERAIGNLVDNALKWSPPGGRVRISAAAGTVEVSDDGPGIPADDLPHIFDRFYRSATARALPGSGLGLAIVHRIADVHGGTVEAIPLRAGVKFRLTVPEIIVEQPPADQTTAPG